MRITLTPASMRLRLWTGGILMTGAIATAMFLLHPAWELALLSRPSSCLLKVFTGIPCLACRGTRAAIALAHGDVGMALRYNPLAVLFVAAVTTYFSLLSITGKQPQPHLSPRESTCIWSALALALLGNWIYVICRGG